MQEYHPRLRNSKSNVGGGCRRKGKNPEGWAEEEKATDWNVDEYLKLGGKPCWRL